MTNNSEYAVQMKGISKFFGDFCALRQVDLNVRSGSIHALLGENGAGKSTLMNVLYGLYRADEGEIYLRGEKVDVKNPHVAIENGIGMVHQHFMLVENLTVTQNIMLGSENTNALGVLNINKVKQEILDLGDRYGLHVDPDAKIEDISVAMQQRVEILKALYRGVDILILDEPTAVLTPQEIVELIETMHQLTEDGKTIIIITHKLHEIRQSSEYCTIIRRGEYIDTVLVKDTNEEELANMMVGRHVNLHVDKTKANPTDVIMEINDLVVKDHRGIEQVRELDLTLRRGEILGIAGIDGNGQSELVNTIIGLTQAESGSIKINDTEVVNTTPKHIREQGLGCIPEDRQREGLVLDFSVENNLILETYNTPQFSNKRGFLDFKSINEHATEMIAEYDIRPEGSERQSARSLSGGNQQKVIIAREVYNNPEILVAVQPTRGLDVGAIEFVHKALIEQRDNGKAVLLVSFELDEIMDLSDRINVIYGGKIVGELDPSQTNEQEIGLLMAGGGNNQ